jgi:hypothetical protein
MSFVTCIRYLLTRDHRKALGATNNSEWAQETLRFALSDGRDQASEDQGNCLMES